MSSSNKQSFHNYEQKKPTRIDALGSEYGGEVSSFYIDSDFDDLGLAANDSSGTSHRPKQTAHCDCHASNEAFFGRKIKKNSDPGWSYQFVPVDANKNDECPFCGFSTYKLVPHHDLEAFRARGTRNDTSRSRRVIGTNVKTGEKLIFDSEQAARRAGHTNVRYWLELGRPVKGWIWLSFE